MFSTLDHLSPQMKRFAGELHAGMACRPGFHLLNDPVRTLRRYRLLAELHRQGKNDFQAFRATGDLSGLRYPVFLRRDRTHDGAISPWLNTIGETRAAIGRALLQGHPYRDLLVVEFCDTADEAGFYRKYAAFAVGGSVIARSLNRGRHWMMKHDETEYSRGMVMEEREYVAANPHASELGRIFHIAGAGYGRIDYSVKDGRVQTWEINLNPQIGRGQSPSRGRVPPELQAIRNETKKCFYARFEDAWRQSDLVAEGPPVPIALDPLMVRESRRATARSTRVPLLAALRAFIRPVKPLVEPFAPPFLRLLEAAARGLRRGRA